ncbi:B-box type zinc finger protein ncl-1 [Pseudolycoriella hygida]|uniref:B-box type zinc finger protein ncl-1 n=1 Tax=Pseudolycoriella hygida TaxID=35572 RepID=A0A9Q0NFB7_9DIPT|nr:B-box type zinc finger protein ncl-1 [Pseudolycoriella hygida]
MAASPTPSLDSLPGANSIGSFGEPNDYLSDSPLTLSGSSPPVSDSAIGDDFSSGLVSSIESQTSQGSGTGGPRCTGCKSKQSDAVAKCIECANYLCSNCVTAHQFMHCFEGHSVLRINENSGQSLGKIMNGFDLNRLNLKDELSTNTAVGSKLNMCSVISPLTIGSSTNNIIGNSLDTNGSTLKSGNSFFCSRHKNELLKFFCRTCSVTVCKDCIGIDHGLHEIELMGETAPKQIESLLQIVTEVRSKANDLRSVIKNCENNAQRIQIQYNKAQNEISETYQFYISMLEERKQELLKELENSYNAKNLSQSLLVNKSQDHVDKVLQACEFVDRITKHAGDAEAKMLRKLMENKIQSFIPFIQELQSSFELDFVSNYQAIQVGVRNTFGYIRSSPEIPTKQPPIARPTINNLLTNGSTPSSSTGSLNAQQSQLINGCHQTQNSQTSNNITTIATSLIERPYSNGSSSICTQSSQPSLSTFDSNIISKRFNGANSLGPFVAEVNLQVNPYEKWSNGGSDNIFNNISDQYNIPSSNGQNDTMIDYTSKLMQASVFPPKSQIKRQKMIYHCKFGEFGVMEGQFTEPSGVAVNAQNDIIVADTNNHRIQIFDKEGRFKFQFGECGKRDSQLLYPNRVAVVRTSGDIIVTERSPTHQIQIYNQYGQFVRKFGANILQHPRGVTVDNKGHIIVVECKVMRVIIFDQSGNVLQKFGCSKHLEFPNGVVVNDKQEIFISDNRAHCVKVFSYEGVYLRQIGGEGITNYPIGVGINATGDILIADNHNNFNLTIFTQDGQLVSALESKVKHAQCFDVALMDDGSVVLASKDYRLYIYRYVQVPLL